MSDVHFTKLIDWRPCDIYVVSSWLFAIRRKLKITTKCNEFQENPFKQFKNHFQFTIITIYLVRIFHFAIQNNIWCGRKLFTQCTICNFKRFMLIANAKKTHLFTHPRYNYTTIHFTLSALCFQSAANRFKMLNGLKKANWNQLKSIFIQLGFILHTHSRMLVCIRCMYNCLFVEFWNEHIWRIYFVQTKGVDVFRHFHCYIRGRIPKWNENRAQKWRKQKEVVQWKINWILIQFLLHSRRMQTFPHSSCWCCFPCWSLLFRIKINIACWCWRWRDKNRVNK